MLKAVILAACGALVVAVSWDTAWVDSAGARPQYKKAFVARYVKSDSCDPSQATFARRVETAGCAVCHVRDARGRAERTVRNAYGNAFGEHLGRRNSQDGPRIGRALQAAEGARTETDQAKKGAKSIDSPTFGQRIASGHLPVGDE